MYISGLALIVECRGKAHLREAVVRSEVGGRSSGIRKVVVVYSPPEVDSIWGIWWYMGILLSLRTYPRPYSVHLRGTIEICRVEREGVALCYWVHSCFALFQLQSITQWV